MPTKREWLEKKLCNAEKWLQTTYHDASISLPGLTTVLDYVEYAGSWETAKHLIWAYLKIRGYDPNALEWRRMKCYYELFSEAAGYSNATTNDHSPPSSETKDPSSCSN